MTLTGGAIDFLFIVLNPPLLPVFFPAMRRVRHTRKRQTGQGLARIVPVHPTGEARRDATPRVSQSD
jgi:hypothetical protein